jgi:hypothetical protein
MMTIINIILCKMSDLYQTNQIDLVHSVYFYEWNTKKCQKKNQSDFQNAPLKAPITTQSVLYIFTPNRTELAFSDQLFT